MTSVEDWIEFLKGLLPPRPPFLPAPPWEVPKPPEVPEKPPEVPEVPEKPPVPPVVPVEVEGYWELDYTIPKNGHHYACFAKLYQREKSVGGRRAGDSAILAMNVRWIENNVAGVTTATTARKWNGPVKGWLTDMGIREYIPDRYDAPITAPIDQGYFPDSDYDWVWAGYWEGEPYSEGYAFSGGHIYYPSSPEGKYGLMIEGKRVRFIRKYRLTETGNGIKVRIYVSGPPPGPLVETYFHRVNWLGGVGMGTQRATHNPITKMGFVEDWVNFFKKILPPFPLKPPEKVVPISPDEPIMINGYWEIPWNVERDGNIYTCIVKLYNGIGWGRNKTGRIETTGYFDLTLGYKDGGWLISPGMGESRTDLIRPIFKNTKGQIVRNTVFREETMWGYFKGSWASAPYKSYAPRQQLYYPSCPLYRKSWVKEIRLTDTGTEVILKIQVSGMCGEEWGARQAYGGIVYPTPDYWHPGR